MSRSAASVEPSWPARTSTTVTFGPAVVIVSMTRIWSLA